MRVLRLLLVWAFSHGLALAAPRQLIVTTTDGWNTRHGAMRWFECDEAGTWQPQTPIIPVLVGKNGLAWGRGLHEPQPGLQKQEGDNRAPAGHFKIGPAMGYAPRLPEGSHGWEYHPVTERTAWIGDPRLPDYNHLVVLPPGVPEPAWFQKQRSRLGDPAYRWKVLIEHNYPEAVPGLGSAIFFHFRRGPETPSAGCTTLPPEWMEKLVRWLDPAKRPEYVLLPWEEYRRRASPLGWPAWQEMTARS